MAEDRPPYYYLDNLINVLLVDDDPRILELVRQILSPLRLYAITTAATAAKAEKHLSQPARTHLCILDLGIADRERDEFHLLRRFSSRVSFIMLTGCSSPAKGFRCHELGAKSLVEKSGDFDNDSFLRTVNRCALLNIINPRYGLVKDTLNTSTNVLFDHSPTSVSNWALEMAITDRELRNIWKKHLGANAKTILAIYQMFSAAIGYYERQNLSVTVYQNNSETDQANYRRLEEYFHCHRSIITDFIEFGNVVNFI
jgi:DNA-binding NarL/FixJ family response regulator